MQHININVTETVTPYAVLLNQLAQSVSLYGIFLANWEFLFDTNLTNPNDVYNLNNALIHTQWRQLIGKQLHSDRRHPSGITELVMFLFIAHLLIKVSLTQSSFQWYDWAISRVNGVEIILVRRHANHNELNLGLTIVFLFILYCYKHCDRR